MITVLNTGHNRNPSKQSISGEIPNLIVIALQRHMTALMY